MNIQAMIFDVDGTLADTEEAHRLAFNQAFQELGLAWYWSAPQYAELLKTTGGKERIAAFIATLETDPAEQSALRARIPVIHRRKTEAYGKQVRAGLVGLRWGIRRLLVETRAAGIPLAIASTTTRESIDALLTTTLGREAPGWFAMIAAGDEVASKKPAPDIYHLVLDRLGLQVDACIAFEDSGRGLSAAKAAGLFTVVTPTFWTRDDNFSGADLVLSHLGDADNPLAGDDAARIGHPMLGIAELEKLLAQSQRIPHRTPVHRGVGLRYSARPAPREKKGEG